MKRKVAQFLTSIPCPSCHGKRIKAETLSVTFAGVDIADFSQLPLHELVNLLDEEVQHVSKKLALDADGLETLGHGLDEENRKKSADHRIEAGGATHEAAPDVRKTPNHSVEKLATTARLGAGLVERLRPIIDLGLGYLSLDRMTPTLSGGELQRLRLATQLSSELFGVVYVLDEPSAGLHPQDIHALLGVLDGLKARGNSLFVVEHSIEIMQHADWIVDVGPGAGERGGKVLYSGQVEGLAKVTDSVTRGYLLGGSGLPQHTPRKPSQWMKLSGVTRNNLHNMDIEIPLGVLTAVTGVSGSGKSSLVSQALPQLV